MTIIQWLVENDAAKRPSARELQDSPLMPPRIELDKLYLEEVMSVLRHNSDTVQSVITTLFTRKHPSITASQGGHEVQDDVPSSVHSVNTTHNNYHFNYDFDLYSRSLRLVNPVPTPASLAASVMSTGETGGQQQRRQAVAMRQQQNTTSSVSLPLSPALSTNGTGFAPTAPPSPLQLHDAIASLTEKVRIT